MNSYIVSIDAGTTGITVLVIDQKTSICNKYYSEFTQYYPKPGWVEHDGEEIWKVTKKLLDKAFTENNLKYCKAIGITNQRETTILWDKETGKPIYNAIVWQCRRTKSICKKLINSGHESLFKQKTGLVIDSYFSGTKINWILENVPNAQIKANNGELAFGTIDSWLLWKLTDGMIHATDYTNASRTLIFNIDNLNWDNDLLKILNIPSSVLPKVFPSSFNFGKTKKQLFGSSIPITAIAGDQQAALYGQGCINPGESKCTYGTGCFLLTNTGKERINSTSGLLTTIACNSEGQPVYSLEGSVFIGGAVIQWLRDELQILDNASDSEEISLSINDTNGVMLVPAFVGLGAPYWDMEARGIITGLTRGSNQKHIIRAALESIAFQVNDLLDAISQDLEINLLSLKVDGGACKNNFLMQFQSDITGRKIERPKNIESTALGAGMLAGLKVGFWSNIKELSDVRNLDKTFSPNMSNNKKISLLKSWKSAVIQTKIC